MLREPEVQGAEAQVGEWLDCRARITSKELALLHSVKNGILQNACSTSPRAVAHLRKSAHGDKSAVVMLKKNEHHHRTGRLVLHVRSSSTRQLGCVFQDMEPPKSSSILPKSSNTRKPIRCVRFTKAVGRHANIRDQNPSFEMIGPGDPHQHNPNVPKFEDRSHP